MNVRGLRFNFFLIWLTIFFTKLNDFCPTQWNYNYQIIIKKLKFVSSYQNFLSLFNQTQQLLVSSQNPTTTGLGSFISEKNFERQTKGKNNLKFYF